MPWKTTLASGLAQRLALALCVGVALLGGVLLVRSLVAARGAADAPPGVAASDRLAGAPRKRELTALLTPPAAAAESRAAVARLRAQGRRLDEITSARSTWRLTRTLAEGYEFDSRLALTFTRRLTRTGTAGELLLEVTRPGVEAVAYRAEITPGGGITGLQYGTGGDAAQLQSVTVAGDAPLAVGDLRVQDVVDLQAALTAGRVVARGTLATFNAVPLQVFEVELPPAAPGGSPGDAADRPSGRAASALLYCAGPDATPRALRLFDAGGRLLRTFSDVTIEGPHPGTGEPRLRSFRVQSSLTDSATVFHLESLQAERAGGAGVEPPL